MSHVVRSAVETLVSHLVNKCRIADAERVLVCAQETMLVSNLQANQIADEYGLNLHWETLEIDFDS